MKKNPIFAVIALLIVLVTAFSSCEVSLDLKDKDSDTTNAGDTTSGNSILDGLLNGGNKIETDPNGIPMVTVEVTNNKGEVVATEKVTLSPAEIQSGKDFFKPKDEATTTPVGILPERVTEPEEEKTTEPDNKTPQTTTQGSQAKPLTELDIVYSDRYSVVGRIEYDGKAEPYRMARDGEKFVAVTVYNGEEMGIISGTDSFYIVDVANKTYITIPKSLVEEQAGEDEMYKDLLTGEALNLNKKVVEETTEKEYGVTFKVIKYEDGSADYVKGKTLIKTVSKDGSVLHYDSITQDVNAGMFLPPVGFTEKTLDSESVSEMVEDLATTEHVH